MALVALLTFLLIDLAPGSYLEDLATNPQVSAEAVDRMRVQFGLDQPFYQKFLRWGRSVASGDFGYSFVYQRPIGQLIAERISNTVLLNVIALTAAWTLGLALGLAAAASRGSPIDWAIGTVTTILLASPGVVLAVLLLAGAARFGLPIGGLSAETKRSERFTTLDLIRHVLVPRRRSPWSGSRPLRDIRGRADCCTGRAVCSWRAFARCRPVATAARPCAA